jgi:DNA-binding transcriptional ArsR family regulator
MARTPEATRERVLKLAKKGKTPVQIATAVKTSRNNVYLHLRKLREEGLLEEPTDAKTNGHARRNGRGEKPDPEDGGGDHAEGSAGVDPTRR